MALARQGNSCPPTVRKLYNCVTCTRLFSAFDGRLSVRVAVVETVGVGSPDRAKQRGHRSSGSLGTLVIAARVRTTNASPPSGRVPTTPFSLNWHPWRSCPDEAFQLAGQRGASHRQTAHLCDTSGSTPSERGPRVSSRGITARLFREQFTPLGLTHGVLRTGSNLVHPRPSSETEASYAH